MFKPDTIGLFVIVIEDGIIISAEYYDYPTGEAVLKLI